MNKRKMLLLNASIDNVLKKNKLYLAIVSWKGNELVEKIAFKKIQSKERENQVTSLRLSYRWQWMNYRYTILSLYNMFQRRNVSRQSHACLHCAQHKLQRIACILCICDAYLSFIQHHFTTPKFKCACWSCNLVLSYYNKMVCIIAIYK